MCTAARLLRPGTPQLHHPIPHSAHHLNVAWGSSGPHRQTSAPCTHLTEDGDKGPQAPMPAGVQIVPEAQPREKAPKKPKSGKERALTKRDKKEKSRGNGLTRLQPGGLRATSIRTPGSSSWRRQKNKRGHESHFVTNNSSHQCRTIRGKLSRLTNRLSPFCAFLRSTILLSFVKSATNDVWKKY